MSPGEHEGVPSLLEQLEKDMKGQEVQDKERLQEKAKEGTLSLSAFLLTLDKKEEEVLEEGVGQSELEEMVQREEDLKLLHEQRSLLEQVCYYFLWHDMVIDQVSSRFFYKYMAD